MYESPINLFYTDPFIQAIKDEQENYIMKAVQRMDVQVDKQELVKALAYDRGQYEKGFSDGIKESRWISVEERLPEPDEEVFVYLFGGTPYIAWVDKNGNWQTEEFLIDEDELPTAWMPLPELPKEET